MIAALLLALQVAAAPPPLHVRTTERTVQVAVVVTETGPAVRADLLAAALGGTLSEAPSGWSRFVVRGLTLEVSAGLPFARAGGEIHPLGGAPSYHGGHLLVPAQLATELIPRLSATLAFDPASRQLASVAATSGAPASASSASPASPHSARPSSAGSAPPASATSAPPTAAAKRRVVVVDAGHGGRDRGTTGRVGRAVVHEKDIALAVALALRDSLRRRGVQVVLTRDDDTFVPLNDRGRMANQHQGDLFLSIHVNAANPAARNREHVRGFETYFLAEARTEDAKRVEEMENESVRFETGADAPRDDPLSFIILDMAQNEHLRESSDLAEVVQRSLGQLHPGPDRGVKQAGFRVLMGAFMPAVLIEIGFASNAADVAFMTSAQRQRQIAGAIASATMEYLQHYERRMGGGPP
ncbi:MAG TPA: N-acetylmuramoyl-L-alanine amidase [Gemmatimonadaceae bacterium]|nr:N-acetylmuramoyl-L-alanine amidase [Gemmatimonadaceae bacterium]